jgi:hypothetical protein
MKCNHCHMPTRDDEGFVCCRARYDDECQDEIDAQLDEALVTFYLATTESE